MKYFNLLAVGVLALAGCHEADMIFNDPPDMANPPADQQTAPYSMMSAEYAPPNQTKFSVTAPFDKLNSTIITKDDVQLNVDQDPGDMTNWSYRYHVIFSPRAKAQTIRVHNSDPTVDLEGPVNEGDSVDGWGYYWGMHPVGGTKKVHFIGQGTEFYVFIGQNYDIIANVSTDVSHTVKYTPTAAPTEHVLARGRSVRVRTDGTIEESAFADDKELEGLVKKFQPVLDGFHIKPPPLN